VSDDPGIRILDLVTESLEYRVERYLRGELSPSETIVFERELVEPELGGAFREILLIRELLRSAPPHDVPEGLNDRIARAIEIEMAGDVRAAHAEESGLARRTRIAREGFAWIYRGPSLALAGPLAGGFSGTDAAALESSTATAPANTQGRPNTGPESRGAQTRRQSIRAFTASVRTTGRIGSWALRRAATPTPAKPSLIARLRGAR
jgi:hypothetical protein